MHTAPNTSLLATVIQEDSADSFKQRDNFLEQLKSASSGRYKRYLGSPIRYAGGKSLAVGLVLEHLPKVSRVISPFMGGGSVEIAIANELGIPVLGYDIFEELCAYWQTQLAQPAKLAGLVRSWGNSPEKYLEIKQRLKEHWTNKKRIHNKIELAAHYWYNHNLSYGPGFLGWMSKIYRDPARFDRLVNRVERFSAPKLKVKAGNFANILPKYKDDFLYLDPPYYLDGDSKMFKGIYPQRNFPVHHKDFDHHKLAKQLKNHRGGFILSYNDCSVVRELYQGFQIEEVKWQYTLGQGETRIGANRLNDDHQHVKQSHEILIIKKADATTYKNYLKHNMCLCK